MTDSLACASLAAVHRDPRHNTLTTQLSLIKSFTLTKHMSCSMNYFFKVENIKSFLMPCQGYQTGESRDPDWG